MVGGTRASLSGLYAARSWRYGRAPQMSAWRAGLCALLSMQDGRFVGHAGQLVMIITAEIQGYILAVLADNGCPPDVQELLVNGNGIDCRAGLLSDIIKAYQSYLAAGAVVRPRRKLARKFQGTPAQYQKHRQRYKKAWRDRQRENLTDSYLRGILGPRLHMRPGDVPSDLIVAERAILMAERLIEARIDLDEAKGKFDERATYQNSQRNV